MLNFGNTFRGWPAVGRLMLCKASGIPLLGRYPLALPDCNQRWVQLPTMLTS